MGNKTNREIKFRAWDKEFTEQMYQVQMVDFFDDVVFMSKNGYEPEPIKQALTQVELMQYTGLKDEHGVEIYEGDIIRSIYQPTWRLGDENGEEKAKTKRRDELMIVEWDACNPCFVLMPIHGKYPEYDFIVCNMRTNEIIGNIYEHPHLLANNHPT